MYKCILFASLFPITSLAISVALRKNYVSNKKQISPSQGNEQLLVHTNFKKYLLQLKKFSIWKMQVSSCHEFILFSAAAAAKSLQSCLTLCNPIDGSPPGSPIPGILQARTLEWVAISFSNPIFKTFKWEIAHLRVLVVSRSDPELLPPLLARVPQGCLLCSLIGKNHE